MKFRIKYHYNDQELIAGCLRGERKYQESLYNQYGSTMFSICLRYGCDYYQAEDILQEGFIKVFNNLKNFRNEGSFEGWMKRIFVNTSIEWLRRNKMMNQALEIETTPLNMVQRDSFSELAAEDLLKLIQSLSTGYRTVFNLYAIEGYAHKEIAEMLGINEGTSKSQLARARALLQKMVAQQNKIQYAAAVL
ncbi:MAG TPA: RNA polymerase subunit sigma-70 [Bacteroidetes bacterium]|nr:RNA polymerase subunit sigma-70 [Bacteroidota bacterium]